MRELVKKKSAVEKKSKKGILLKLFKPKSGAGGGMGGSGLFGPPSGYTPGGYPSPGYTPGGYEPGYTPGGYTPPSGNGYTPGGTRGGTEGYQTTPPSGSDPLRSTIGLGILGAGLGGSASGSPAPYIPGGL